MVYNNLSSLCFAPIINYIVNSIDTETRKTGNFKMKRHFGINSVTLHIICLLIIVGQSSWKPLAVLERNRTKD